MGVGGIFEKWENDYLTRWQGNHQMEYKFVVVVLPFFFTLGEGLGLPRDNTPKKYI